MERKSDEDPIQEFIGPVLDYNCNKICNICCKSIQMAKELWIGNVPNELKSLRFVEKLLIARVRHTCCYVKIASGM